MSSFSRWLQGPIFEHFADSSFRAPASSRVPRWPRRLGRAAGLRRSIGRSGDEGAGPPLRSPAAKECSSFGTPMRRQGDATGRDKSRWRDNQTRHVSQGGLRRSPFVLGTCRDPKGMSSCPLVGARPRWTAHTAPRRRWVHGAWSRVACCRFLARLPIGPSPTGCRPQRKAAAVLARRSIRRVGALAFAVSSPTAV